RDDVADEGFVLRALGAKAGRFIAAPYDGIGRALDLLDLVTMDGALVAGKVEDAAAISAQRLPDREQNRIAEPPADQQHAFAAGRFSRVPGRPHQNDRLSGGKLCAKVG